MEENRSMTQTNVTDEELAELVAEFMGWENVIIYCDNGEMKALALCVGEVCE
jgi:hypothetical protein